MSLQQTIVLSSVQRRAYEGLLAGVGVAGVLLLKARPQSGRTTILRKLHEELGGAFLDAPAAADFMEEIFFQEIEQALAHHEIIIVDDFHLVMRAAAVRTLLVDAALTAVLGEAAAWRKSLIFGTDYEVPWSLVRRAVIAEV